MTRRPQPILGVFGGIAMAVLMSLAALAIAAIGGSRGFEKLGVSVGAVIGTYFAGGILGGLTVGALMPLATWRWGAAILGILGALPVYLGAGMLLGLSDHSSGLLVTTIVGGGVGYEAWTPLEHDTQAPFREFVESLGGFMEPALDWISFRALETTSHDGRQPLGCGSPSPIRSPSTCAP